MSYLIRLMYIGLFALFLGAQGLAAPVTDDDLHRIWQRGALSEMQLLAEKGDVRAQHWMGLMLHNRGKYDEAIGWYSRAVENGDAKSAERIAFFYERGLGRSKDLDKALSWHLKGAQLGDFQSQIAYAAALRNGEVLARNEREAFRWYAKAAAQRGYSQRGYAYLPIAEMYARGAGVRRDLGRAYTYARAAELTVNESDARNKKEARTLYRAIRKRLSPEELANAKRLYNELVPDASDPLPGTWILSLLIVCFMSFVIWKNRRVGLS